MSLAAAPATKSRGIDPFSAGAAFEPFARAVPFPLERGGGDFLAGAGRVSRNALRVRSSSPWRAGAGAARRAARAARAIDLGSMRVSSVRLREVFDDDVGDDDVVVRTRGESDEWRVGRRGGRRS